MRRKIMEMGEEPCGRIAPGAAGGGPQTAALHARLHDAAQALSFEDLQLAVRVFDMVARHVTITGRRMPGSGPHAADLSRGHRHG